MNNQAANCHYQQAHIQNKPRLKINYQSKEEENVKKEKRNIL